MDVHPEFIQLDTTLAYDNSLERTEIIEIACSKSTQNSLNSANSQLCFLYGGDFSYKLSSPNSGFLMKF